MLEVLLILCIIPGFFLAVNSPRLLMLVVWLLYLLNNGLAYYLNFDIRTYLLATGLLLGAIGAAIVTVLQYRTTVINPALRTFLLFTLGVAAFYFFMRPSRIDLVAFKGVIETFQYPLWAASLGVLFSLKRDPFEKNVNWVLSISVKFMFIHSLAIILQWLFFPSLKGYDPSVSISQWDIYNGLFGGYGTGSVTPVLAGVVATAIAYRFHTRQAGFMDKALLLLLPFALVVSEGKAGIFAMGAGLLASFLLFRWRGKAKRIHTRRMARGIGIAFFLLVVLGLSDRLLQQYYSGSLLWSREQLVEYLFREKTSQGTLPRLGSLVALVAEEIQDPDVLATGHGPGSSVGITAAGDIAEWHINTLYGVASRALNRLIYELGLLGILSYSLILLLCVRAAKASCRLADMSGIFSVVVIVLVLLSVFAITNYYSVLTDRQIGIYVWTLLGIFLSASCLNSPEAFKPTHPTWNRLGGVSS
ncbi:MAG: hypothetical protein ACETWG_08030 [Candidatus Neomarinimicrobiota bacterium]